MCCTSGCERSCKNECILMVSNTKEMENERLFKQVSSSDEEGVRRRGTLELGEKIW